MRIFAAKSKNFVFALIFVGLAILAINASAETCGICKDSYLSCISGGGSSSSCDQQLRSCQSACFGGDGKSSSTSGLSAVFLVIVVGLAAYFYLDSRQTKKEKEKEIAEEQSRRSKMTQEDIAREQEEIAIKQQLEESRKLRNSLVSNLQNMTVDEIIEFTKSSRRSTTTWLVRNGYTCKDYDGAAKREAVLSKLEADKK